jgi:hypothetical protein
MISIEISAPPNQISFAILQLEKLIKINHFDINLKIGFDYLMEKSGEWDPENPTILKINPFICSDKKTYAYTEDNTMYGIVIHEFSHFLSVEFFKGFMDDYIKEFPEERLLITTYEEANEKIEEEVAELISLYVRNPYLLKLISKKHYFYIKRWFKTPVLYDKNKFIQIYSKMEREYKDKLYKKWGIVVNYNDKTVRIDK